MQQLPNTNYETIGLIVNHLKLIMPLSDNQKIAAVEFLEDLTDDTLYYIITEKDVDFLVAMLWEPEDEPEYQGEEDE